MRYQLTNEFQPVQERCGILQNLHNDAIVEFVTVRESEPKAGEGILVRSNEKIQFSLGEDQKAYVRNIRPRCEPIPIVITEANFKKPASSGGAGAEYQQITKLNVTAPKIERISIKPTETFCLPAVEVLKFQPGEQDVLTTVCAFDNSDADDFFIGELPGDEAPCIIFDGVMKPKMQYEISIDNGVILGDGYIFETEEIDFSQFKKVEAVAVE